jgi:hypothetical protein
MGFLIRRSGRRVTLPVVVVMLALIAVTTAASAWAVRGLVSDDPQLEASFGGSPLQARATLTRSVTVAGGRTASLWRVPTTTGGKCLFLNIDPAGAESTEFSLRGGGWCRPAGHDARDPIELYLTWTKIEGGFAVLGMGETAPNSKITRLELRTAGKLQPVVAHANSFVIQLPASSGSGALAPGRYDLVGISADGDEIAQVNINDVVARATP